MAAAMHLIVYYDETCAFCQALRRRLTRLQRKAVTIEWRHFEDAPACGLDGHDCSDSMKVKTPDGKLLEGFYAARYLTGATKLRWLRPVLYVPGVPFVGRRAYAWVARNRYRISRRLQDP